MIGELGHFALVLALVAALCQGVAGLLPQAPARLHRAAIDLQALGLLAAFVALAVAFVQNDFTLVYVVQHSNRDLPVAFRIAAVWGGHEGSMLLWTLILAGWTVTAERSLAKRDATHARHMAGVLGVVSVAMLTFVLFTSNPFIRLLPAAQEGRSLNPLLQDPGLIFHPPLLYLGYVGTVVPFAAVLARMLSPVVPAGSPELWVRWLRPFTLWAFTFLTLGIALGSWWAYYELGWGGWWFWDPVENASLMPWLALAALLHVLAVREQRGVMSLWTGVLAVTAFTLSLLGTFLVRSGVLTSVHAFASDPKRGSVMLALVACTLGVSFLLISARAARLAPVRAVPAYQLWSREGLVSVNNVLLVASCATVLLGTLYPLAMDALGLGKISVGPPYFDAVMRPLLLPLLLVAAVGPWLTWAAVDMPRLWAQLRLTLVLTFAAAVAIPMGLVAIYGRASPLAVVGLVLAAGLLVSTVLHAWRQRRGGGHGVGYGPGACGGGGVCSGRDHGQHLWRGARRAIGPRRNHHAGGLFIAIRRGHPGQRRELRQPARPVRAAVPRRCCATPVTARKAQLPRLANAHDRVRHRLGRDPRPLRGHGRHGGHNAQGPVDGAFAGQTLHPLGVGWHGADGAGCVDGQLCAALQKEGGT
jgi:cytochrome c-type biogenesis protein CcmF